MTCPPSSPAKKRRLSPAFAAAESYAATIPAILFIPDKTRAVHHLCKMLCAAILAGEDNEVMQ